MIGKETKEIPADTASIGKVEKMLLRFVKRLEKWSSQQKNERKAGTVCDRKAEVLRKNGIESVKKQRTETGQTLALPDKSMER